MKLKPLLLATALVVILSYLVLLSPPLKGVREFFGLKEPEERRYNPTTRAAELDAPPKMLAREAFVYHSIFAILLAMTLLPIADYRVSWLAVLGALTTAAGGMGYSYLGYSFEWHGLFLLGLSLLFASGLLSLKKPSNLVEFNIQLSILLLLAGGIIGGWLGSSFMRWRGAFVEAVRAARFNPDLAEESFLWRALTAHEHAMLAVALTLAFLVGAKLAGVRKSTYLYLVALGQVMMALASFSVWWVGKVAHVIITPAALLLILGTTLTSLKFPRDKLEYLTMNLAIWVTVALPGAIVAMSLRKPLILSPAFRDPLWDWAELAYNTGHWHILLGFWGVLVLTSWMTLLSAKGMCQVSRWLSIVGMSLASVGVNLYALASGPGRYSPNPYDNPWLVLVELGLVTLTIGVALGYFSVIRRSLPSQESTLPHR